MDIKKIEYIMQNIYSMHGVLVQVILKDGRVISPIKDAKGLLFKDVLNKPDICGRYVSEMHSIFGFYSFSDSNIRILFGPFTYEKASRYDVSVFLKKYSECSDITVPVVSDARMRELIAAAHGLIVENYELNMLDLFKSIDEQDEIETKKQLVSSMVNNIDNEMLHFSYKREREYFEEIIASLENEDLDFEKYKSNMDQNYVDIKNGASTLSASNFKDAEYMLICCVVLVSRYAMKAGADEDDTYNLSDVILRNLSETKSIEGINALTDRFWSEIRQILLEAKNSDSSPYIEKTKNFIARNVFKTLKLKDIAKSVGLNASYLSRIFSKEVGTTVFDYIKKEKIKRSCNLLRYSDKGIAEIADYISMAPQSYYTKVFKQYMSITPSEYRRTYRDENF
ncbi:MAG: AraC family transcriptional regulator [Pseudobutyrivibrio sp.]|nr:AraC family transcriptional regulator [Pseudobutyrivibrio sp.]